MGRLKDIWYELTEPIVDEFVMEACIRALMRELCLIEAPHEDFHCEANREYLHLILKRYEFSDKQIDELINIAM